MPHARKTARITTRGYYPPCSLYEPEELQEEPEELQEELEDTTPTPPSTPDQAPEPVLPQEEIEPKEEVIYLSADEDVELAHNGGQPP
jgi:hypothetical protein